MVLFLLGIAFTLSALGVAFIYAPEFTDWLDAEVIAIRKRLKP